MINWCPPVQMHVQQPRHVQQGQQKSDFNQTKSHGQSLFITNYVYNILNHVVSVETSTEIMGFTEEELEVQGTAERRYNYVRSSRRRTNSELTWQIT
jgi:hypothetical protein